MSDAIARLRDLRAKATPGPWHHVNPFESVPAERTIHGPVPGQRVDYVSTWPHFGTPRGHSVVIPMYGSEKTASSSDMAAIVSAVNALPALLDCAEALEKIANSPTSGVGCNPAEFVKIARAAINALEKEKLT